jgi:hypothetical protein
MGSSEYGPALNPLRPGGELVTIPLKTQTKYYNVSEDEVYHMIGDRDSSLFTMISLVTACHVTPAWPSKFIPTSSNSTIRIENVIQYYRASSFALAYRGYNNTLSLDNAGGTPLPEAVTYSKFMRCIDDTIINALPIMNTGAGLASPGATVGWFLLSYGFWVVVLLIALLSICHYLADWMTRRFLILIKRDPSVMAARKAAQDARLEMLAYENYP